MVTITTAQFVVNNALIAELNEFQVKDATDLRGTMPRIKSLALKYTAEMARLVNYPAEQDKLREQVALGAGNMFPDVFRLFEVATATSEDAAKILKSAEPAARAYKPSAALVKVTQIEGQLRSYFADLFGTIRAQNLALAALCKEVHDLKAAMPRKRGLKASQEVAIAD